MATTTYKGYELQVTGSNSGTWGDTLNTDALQRIDLNLGGITTKSLTSSNVSLSTDESRSAILRLTGTISANIIITTSCQGFFFVENATSGAYAVTITNGVGSAVVAPQGRRTPFIADATNGARVASTAEFAAGTVMLFVQTAAPTGWTKSTSHNDKALRIVSGTASSGGSTAFTTVFASRSVPTTDSTTLTTSQIPAHQHFLANSDSSGLSDLSASNSLAFQRAAAIDIDYSLKGTATAATWGLSSSTGGGTGHTHTMSTAMDFAVQYVDVIAATRDSN